MLRLDTRKGLTSGNLFNVAMDIHIHSPRTSCLMNGGWLLRTMVASRDSGAGWGTAMSSWSCIDLHMLLNEFGYDPDKAFAPKQCWHVLWFIFWSIPVHNWTCFVFGTKPCPVSGWAFWWFWTIVTAANGSNFFETLRSFNSCHLGNNHIVHIYPLVICYIAIENDHRNRFIVDLPINSMVDLSIVFCMFTRPGKSLD